MNSSAAPLHEPSVAPLPRALPAWCATEKPDVILFGFFIWSTFAVAVAMSHELLPGNVGLASGMMLGLAIGFGGLGVAVNGIIADHYSLAAALGTIPIPIAFAKEDGLSSLSIPRFILSNSIVIKP